MQTSLRSSAFGLKSVSSPKALRSVKVPRAVRVMASSVSTASPAATVEVELGDRTYPIYIGSGLLAGGDLLRKHVPGNTALVVTNETVAPLYLDRVVAALSEGGEIRVETVVLPDGEEHKNVDVLMKVFDKALDARLDRQTTFVALGGGVIGDMTGFAAASYQRGVHFVQIPTTVMAMVDSSVGGKTGVNHPAGKNMIGAFYQPRCVLVDTDTLSTLPDREYKSGMAEVVKYGLIRDADFFEWQERNVDALMARDGDVVVKAIERSCVNKAEVVALDEKGRRRPRDAQPGAHVRTRDRDGHRVRRVASRRGCFRGDGDGGGHVRAARVDRRERRAAHPGPAEEVRSADGRPGGHDRGDVREAHGRGQESREREAQADSAQGRPRRVRVHRRLRRAGARRDAGRVRAEVTTRVCDLTGL